MSRLMWRNYWKMLSRNIETFLECDKTYEEADTVLFGAPFDSTTSFRPGTRFGSGAIRHESFGLESYSPYQDRDLRNARIMDSGDLELPFGNTEEVLREIEERAAEILEAGKRPFLLGGEHLVTLGAFRAALKKYPDLCMIHFDAHTDLREDYLGVPLSHACVIRRCWELAGELFTIPEDFFIKMLRLSGKKHFLDLVQTFLQLLKVENILRNEKFKEV